MFCSLEVEAGQVPKSGYRMTKNVRNSFQVDRHLNCLKNCTVSPICMWLVQLPCCWQDVPAHRTRHSAHRQLDRPCRRQRLGLVQHHLHSTPLNFQRTTLCLTSRPIVCQTTCMLFSLMRLCSYRLSTILLFSAQMYFKIIKSGTDRKLVYDFLLVVYSNFSWTPIVFFRNLDVAQVGWSTYFW